MLDFTGKKGVVFGVANDRSIAWHISKVLLDQGAEIGFTHLPDRPDDERKKSRGRVEKAIGGHPGAKFLVPCNVQDDAQIAEVFAGAKETFGTIDFLIHAIAYANLEDLKVSTMECSRDGFKLAMEISAFSLLAVANGAREVLADNASIVTLTYLGGEKCVPGYNVMGVCKSALDACTRYLAFDLGLRGIRCNAISAGPLKTLASSAVGAKGMEELYAEISPLGRNITHSEVGNVGAFLLHPASSGITGEILHVDAGYSIMGTPGRLLDKFQDASKSG